MGIPAAASLAAGSGRDRGRQWPRQVRREALGRHWSQRRRIRRGWQCRLRERRNASDVAPTAGSPLRAREPQPRMRGSGRGLPHSRAALLLHLPNRAARGRAVPWKRWRAGDRRRRWRRRRSPRALQAWLVWRDGRSHGRVALRAARARADPRVRAADPLRTRGRSEDRASRVRGRRGRSPRTAPRRSLRGCRAGRSERPVRSRAPHADRSTPRARLPGRLPRRVRRARREAALRRARR